VLKNKLGLRDKAELSAFEALSVAVRAEEPLPVGRFSSAHIALCTGISSRMSTAGPDATEPSG